MLFQLKIFKNIFKMDMESGKVFIHIGLPKTGTTYMQNYFFNKLDNVEMLHSPKFYKMFSKKIDEKRNINFLLSNEGLSGVVWNHNWLLGKKNEFHWFDSFIWGIKKLKLLFPNAIIIIFFRRHGDLLLSIYKQYIHAGGTMKLSEFYNEKGVIRDEDLNFKKRIKYIRSNFNELYIFSYEDYKEKGDQYLIDFFKSKGLKVNLTDKKKPKSNISISGKKIGLLRTINKLYIRFPLIIRKVFSRLKISPRQIIQNYLSFWTTQDSIEYIQLKEKINHKFKDDWKYVENNKIGIR